MKRRNRTSRKHSNVLVGVAIVIVVVVLAICLKFRGDSIKAKNAEDEATIAQLTAEIEAEKERATQIDEYSKYVKTKQFAESVARTKLGLIYPDEVVFKSED